MTDPAPDPATTRAKLGDIAATAGLRRIHVIAWRDLDDVEAGGSEVHAATVARLWSEAGIEVLMRTSWAQGHPNFDRRDGYEVVRKGGPPQLQFHGGAARRFAALGAHSSLLTITHSDKLALAQVLLLER